jgi:CBS domain-containing protein
MLDQSIRTLLKRRNLLTLPPYTSVTQAAKQMAARNVGAALVVEGDALVGIFTERDIAFRVVAKSRDAASTPISAVMTPDPVTITADKPFGLALVVMHEHGFRHLPVVEGRNILGIISARSAMDPDLEEFVSEAQRRKSYSARR